MMAAQGLTRTPSGRIRRIPSDLMKRVRCAYPGCDLAVIPSNFARHWKFKHTDLPQPPIESLTVVRGDNSSDSGDVSWPSIYKNNENTSTPKVPSVSIVSVSAINAAGNSSTSPALLSTTPHLRVDGKERKRARQRNYICPECQRPLIGSNFGRHWASKHPHLSQPSLVDLEMEALSGEEDAGNLSDPLSLSSHTSINNKQTVKKRKVVCRECEMPMINSNFSRHWASRHPHLVMPQLSDLEVIDVEVEASSSPPFKKTLSNPPPLPPITIPYPEEEDEEDEGGNMEPADEEFEDLEEIEDEEEEEEVVPHLKAAVAGRTHNHHGSSIEYDYDDEDLEEVTVEPLHYTNGTSAQNHPVGSLHEKAASGNNNSSSSFGFGGKRHKKVFCPECNMPMLCNNFRRHFHRRHGEMLHRMPSIHSLNLVPDEEYEMAQINKVVPPYNTKTNVCNPPPSHKDFSNSSATSSYPEVQAPLLSNPLVINNNNNVSTGSPVRVKRKIVCSECGMAMIGSNFGRHWASKHAHLPQPALQDLVYADSAESGEAETVVCEPLFFGPDDLSEDDESAGEHHHEEPDEEEEESSPLFCDFEQCSFSSHDKVSLHHHRIKYGHFNIKNNNGYSSGLQSSKSSTLKVKKVWKKKVVCPECNLQTITSNFSRHWMAKHGHLPTPGLRDLQVITIDDPGFQGNSNPSSYAEAEEIVVDPTIPGMNTTVYEAQDEDDYEDFDISEDQVECVQELDDDDEDDEEGEAAATGVASTSNHSSFQEEDGSRVPNARELEDEADYDDDDDEEDDDEEDDDDIDEIKIEPADRHESKEDENNTRPLKYSNNKINCNFDINSLLEDDDDDGDDQDESGEFASVEVN